MPLAPLHPHPSVGYPRWIDERAYRNLREVGPDLFVGGEMAPACNGRVPYDTIIAVHRESDDPTVQAEREAVYRHTRRVFLLPFPDGRLIPHGVMDMALAAYEAREGPVLVHCAMGLSRSASVAYGLLRRIAGFTHPIALDRVRTPGQAGYPLAEPLAAARAWATTG